MTGETHETRGTHGTHEPDETGRRPGRWRTGAESRERILHAARAAFGRYGYDRATVRRIAGDARVDPAMVHYFFRTKAQLFAAAMALPANPAERIASVLEDGLDGLGARLLWHFLGVWDDAAGFEPLFALLRSAPNDDQSAGLLREFLQREVFAQVREVVGAPDAHLRAELVGSQLMGVALARYVLRVEPLASASRETLVAWVGPTLQRYLEDPAPGT